MNAIIADDEGPSAILPMLREAKGCGGSGQLEAVVTLRCQTPVTATTSRHSLHVQQVNEWTYVPCSNTPDSINEPDPHSGHIGASLMALASDRPRSHVDRTSDP